MPKNTTKCRALAQGTAGGIDPADCDWPHCGCDVPVTIVQEFRLPEGMRPPIRVRGVGRVADEPRALLVMFTDIPTDDEIRQFHDYVRDLAHDR